MNAVVFIRTYPKDYEWLRYCLRSLRKNAPGVPVVIVTSGPEASIPSDLLGGVSWRASVEKHPDDYIGQQLTKLNADLYVPGGCDFIIHIDSDTVLLDSLEKLFVGGRPTMLRSPYDKLPSDFPWKAPTEKHLGWGVSHEYMRRFPLIYPAGLYTELRSHLMSRCPDRSWSGWVASIEGRQLSEFNLLGAFAFEKMHDAFHWIDTDVDPLPDLIVNQRWSWGGIDAHRAELEQQFPSTHE